MELSPSAWRDRERWRRPPLLIGQVRMDRNYLKGPQGHAITAVLGAVSSIFKRLLVAEEF